MNWLIIGGFVIGLLALPLSRGLIKPKLLKRWLRIEFWISLVPALFLIPLFFYCRQFIVAEDGDYVLYHMRPLLMGTSYYEVGKKQGFFIRELPYRIYASSCDDKTADCFRFDTGRGCLYGMKRGTSPVGWVLPIDSARYHHNADYIFLLIDSLYQAQPLIADKSYGSFVFPDDFAEISYSGDQYYSLNQICYKDSMTYLIESEKNDSLSVTIFNDQFTCLSFPRNTFGNFSPKEVRAFLEKLEWSKEPVDPEE